MYDEVSSMTYSCHDTSMTQPSQHDMVRVATSPGFLESESSPSPACLESSLSLTGHDPSPSPAGFKSESRCLWLESESKF